MALIAVTRLRIRSWRFLPAFFWHSWRSMAQARRAAGFLGARLGTQLDRTFWTLTAWTDEPAMRAYRASGAHRAAMPKLAEWCDEAAVGHWLVEAGEAFPDWMTAHRQMVAMGRLSPIRYPSSRHQAGTIAPPAFSRHSGRFLKPYRARLNVAVGRKGP